MKFAHTPLTRRSLLAVGVAAFAARPALAAPFWLERRFAPKPRLLDKAFETHDAASTATVSHELYDRAIGPLIRDGDDGVRRVAYGAATPETVEALGAYISLLEGVVSATLNRDEQFALYANLYNAATVRAVLASYPVASIREIDDVWDAPVATVAGRALTLNDIEHGVMRSVFRTPLVHYALNCASIGCPNLPYPALRGDGLSATLEAAARAYVNHPRGVSVARGATTVSKIYGWFADDFGGGDAAVIGHLRSFADAPLLAALDGAAGIDDYAYNWSLNDAL